MEKLKSFINKYDVLFVFIIFCTLLIMPSFGLKLFLFDELWNFSNVYKMINGYQIYQDCNVIVTPLFFYIGKFLLQIIGANLFGFRVYSLLINTFLFTSSYVLFKNVKISKKKSLAYTLLLLIITNEIIFWGANYNNLAIAFIIVGITFFIKNKSFFWQGLIILLIFMTKQNLGVYYAIGITLARITRDKNIKKTIIETIINALFVGVLFSLYIIYLYFCGNLKSFIDLTFFGISEFSEKNFYTQLGNIGAIIFQITIIICAIIVIKNKKIPLSDENRVYLKTIVAFSIPILLIEYPIFNAAHLMLANILIIITYIILLEKMMFKDILKDKKIKILIISFELIILSIVFIKVLGYVQERFETDQNSPYYGVRIDDKTRNSMNTVCEYIRENNKNNKKTIIVSYKADLYFNLLKQSNNKFDLPFLGNMGKEGEDGLISEMDKMENTYILISTDKLLMQESEKIVNYIKNNFEQVGTIDEFNIYKSHDM